MRAQYHIEKKRVRTAMGLRMDVWSVFFPYCFLEALPRDFSKLHLSQKRLFGQRKLKLPI